MLRDESKNFFYDITITTPDGKRSARLTSTLLRMCSKVEVTETIASDDGTGASSAVLSFVETDLLPDRKDKTPMATTAGHGYITNRTGALIDLRFDSEKGFTYVSPQELESGITQSSRTKSRKSESVVFLFAANNKVKVTWGTLEPKSSRTRTFQIGAITYGAGSGGNTLNLQCYDLSIDLSRLSLDEGKIFVKDESKAGYQFANPETLKQVLFRLAKTFNARLVFDKQEVINYPIGTDKYLLNRTQTGDDTLPPEQWSPITLLRSVDIHSQIRDLANNYNSVYEIYDDQFTGNPVIAFTSLALRFPKSIRTLTYRDNTGIVLDFSLNTMDGSLGKSTAVSTIDQNGKSESNYVDAPLTIGTNAHTFDPIPLVYDTNAREFLKRKLVSNSYTAPNSAKDALTNEAETKTVEKSFMGYLTLKTVGHPDFKPDLMEVRGIGVRASTTYRFYQVQHSLSSSGYVCSLQGKTQTVTEAGVANSEQISQNEEYVQAKSATGT